MYPLEYIALYVQLDSDLHINQGSLVSEQRMCLDMSLVYKATKIHATNNRNGISIVFQEAKSLYHVPMQSFICLGWLQHT